MPATAGKRCRRKKNRKCASVSSVGKTSTAEEKDDLQDKFENWRKLPPEEKATARRNFERCQKLSPDERERLQERWEEYRKLPPERREEIKRRLQTLREMPPEKRQELRQKLRNGASARRRRSGDAARKCANTSNSYRPNRNRRCAKNFASSKQHGTLEEKRQFREKLREKSSARPDKEPKE